MFFMMTYPSFIFHPEKKSSIETLKLSSFSTDDETAYLIESVIEAVRSIGDIGLVVKLHPNQRVRDFAQLLRKEDKNVATLIDKTDLNELLESSDLIVAKNSTVVMEAVLMGKPVVIVNLGKRPNLMPYAESNVAIAVRRPEDITCALKKALHDEDAKEKMQKMRGNFIDNFLYKADGKARERVLKLIEDF